MRCWTSLRSISFSRSRSATFRLRGLALRHVDEGAYDLAHRTVVIELGDGVHRQPHPIADHGPRDTHDDAEYRALPGDRHRHGMGRPRKRRAILVNDVPAWVEGCPAQKLVLAESEQFQRLGVAQQYLGMGTLQEDANLHVPDGIPEFPLASPGAPLPSASARLSRRRLSRNDPACSG